MHRIMIMRRLIITSIQHSDFFHIQFWLKMVPHKCLCSSIEKKGICHRERHLFPRSRSSDKSSDRSIEKNMKMDILPNNRKTTLVDFYERRQTRTAASDQLVKGTLTQILLVCICLLAATLLQLPPQWPLESH